MTDDDPLDLEAVAADAAALDALGTDADPTGVPADLGLVLLRELRADVLAEPIELEPVLTPTRPGSSVVVLAGRPAAGRRTARSGAALALLTAGVLSVGGVAAASTVAPVGSPLRGLGDAVRSAAGAFADAVTPPRTAPVLPTPSPTPTGDAREASAAGAARSAAAARQVAALLDAAQQLLGAGRTAQAEERLDAAEQRLVEVLPVHGPPGLAARLEQLRGRLAAAKQTADAPGGKAEPGRSAGPAHAPSAGKPDGKPAPKPARPARPAKPAKPATQPAEPAGEPAPKPDKPAASRPDQPGSKAKSTQPPEPDGAPERSAPAKGVDGTGKGASPARQPSSDASAKPRA